MWKAILGASIVMLAFMVIFGLIYIFINFFNMKRQKEHFRNLHLTLAKGQKVKFANGLYGKIIAIDGTETVDIEVRSGMVIEVSRYAISEIVE